MQDYQSRPKFVKAMQYKSDKKGECNIPGAGKTVAGRHVIDTVSGKRTLRAGDYVVQTGSGIYVMSEGAFEAQYELVKAGGKGKKFDPIIVDPKDPEPIIPIDPPEPPPVSE